MRNQIILDFKNGAGQFWRLLSHSFLLFFRNSLRYRSYFLINILGLSTGLASCFLIYLWVQDELRVDAFYDKSDQLYQIFESQKINNQLETFSSTPVPLLGTLENEFPEVEKAVGIFPPEYDQKGIVSRGGDRNRFKADGQYVSPDFFDVFSFKLLAGDLNAFDGDKRAVFVSDQLAYKLYPGVDDPLGKTIEWDYKEIGGTFQIAGIFEAPPHSARMQFDLLFHWDHFLKEKPNLVHWYNAYPDMYVLLKKGASPDQFNEKIKNLEKEKDDQARGILMAHRYQEGYLYGKFENGKIAGGRIEYVRLFSIIAVFILLISCINFMNLATARASRRLKEIGVKKALGAHRGLLILQYLGESILMSTLAFLLSLLWMTLLLPFFNQITLKDLSLNFDLNFIVGATVIILITGILSGSYPAIYLSGFEVVKVLKGKVHTAVGEVWTRRGLVIIQFTVSVILMVSVLVVYFQMRLIQDKNLGYQRENIISIRKEGGLENKMEPFVSALKKLPEVENASSMFGSILGGFGTTSAISWPGLQERTSVHNQEVGYDFVETLGMELKEGRSFSRDYGREKNKLILNESAVSLMGFEHPLGQKVKLWDQDWEVIGVLKNFHFESLYQEVKPCFLHHGTDGNTILVKIKAGQEENALAAIESQYQKYNPGLAFEFEFMDSAYQRVYESEKRVALLSQYFAGIAILISCLGLFGLAAFSTDRRIKEIGIRKILGAANWQIIYLMSRDFTRMVLAAIIIGTIFSYILAREWLDQFAYRIDLHWGYFAFAGILVLGIAWLTVGMQTWRAARSNPVHCLRDE